jgi:hypothetical protein
VVWDAFVGEEEPEEEREAPEEDRQINRTPLFSVNCLSARSFRNMNRAFFHNEPIG